MSSRVLPRMTLLFGVLVATLVSLAACSDLRWEEAPLREDQGRSPGYEGQFL